MQQRKTSSASLSVCSIQTLNFIYICTTQVIHASHSPPLPRRFGTNGSGAPPERNWRGVVRPCYLLRKAREDVEKYSDARGALKQAVCSMTVTRDQVVYTYSYLCSVMCVIEFYCVWVILLPSLSCLSVYMLCGFSS